MTATINLQIVLYPRPKRGIEATPICPDYHIALGACVQTSDKTVALISSNSLVRTA